MKDKFTDFAWNNLVWFIFIGAIIIMGIFQPIFFTKDILLNILTQSAVFGVLTAGICFAILIGHIDLSMCGNMLMSALLGVLAINAGLPWPLGIVVMVGIGSLVGFANGLMVGVLRTTDMIATLAMNMVLQGLALAITQGRTVLGFPDGFKFIGQGYIGSIPVLPILFIIIYVIVYIIWNKTTFGRSLYAIGGNADCAAVSGIKVKQVKIKAFVVAGLFAGIAGVMLSSYLGSVTANFGESYQMEIVAAAAIGGVTLRGGQGKITGVLGGVFLMTVISIGLQIMGVDSYLSDFVKGLMIMLAVFIDAIRVKVRGL